MGPLSKAILTSNFFACALIPREEAARRIDEYLAESQHPRTSNRAASEPATPALTG